MFSRSLYAATALGLTLAIGGAAYGANDKATVEIGTLTCEQTDRSNLVIWSEAEFACVFDAVDDQPEHYVGEITKIGVDLTIEKIETLKWMVFAPSDTTDRGALEGTYVGASADVAAGAGVGVRALVGGMEESFTLQPVSASAETGIGAGIGVEQFKLRHSGS